MGASMDRDFTPLVASDGGIAYILSWEGSASLKPLDIQRVLDFCIRKSDNSSISPTLRLPNAGFAC